MTLNSTRYLITITLAVLVLVGCSDDAIELSDNAEMEPETPYILKQGCTFKIVTEQGSGSVTSPDVSGPPGTSASASVSFGKYEIEVSNCEVSKNPAGLPIYR